MLLLNSRRICRGQSELKGWRRTGLLNWRLGGLPSSIVGVRALAFFCYLWIVVWSKLKFDESKEKR